MKAWWLWRTHPAPPKRVTELVYDEGSASTVRSRRAKTGKRREIPVEFMLPWDYVKEGVYGQYFRRDDHFVLRDAHNDAQSDSIKGLAIVKKWLYERHAPNVGAGGVVALAPVFGRMNAFEIRDLYTPGDKRSQRYDFLLTPPVYKFCDFTGVVSSEAIGPTDFWIQPTVYAEHAEILQGGVVTVHVNELTGRYISRPPLHWAIDNDELQAALDGTGGILPKHNPIAQRVAEVVRIALDSYLEREEADPRFLDQDHIYRMVAPKPF